MEIKIANELSFLKFQYVDMNGNLLKFVKIPNNNAKYTSFSNYLQIPNKTIIIGDFCISIYSFKNFIHTNLAMKIIKANIVESILGTKRGGGAGLVESCL